MSTNSEREITCKQCGIALNVDFAALAKPDSVTFKGSGDRTRVEVFSVPCPNCGHRNAVEVSFREVGDG